MELFLSSIIFFSYSTTWLRLHSFDLGDTIVLTMINSVSKASKILCLSSVKQMRQAVWEYKGFLGHITLLHTLFRNTILLPLKEMAVGSMQKIPTGTRPLSVLQICGTLASLSQWVQEWFFLSHTHTKNTLAILHSSSHFSNLSASSLGKHTCLSQTKNNHFLDGV